MVHSARSLAVPATLLLLSACTGGDREKGAMMGEKGQSQQVAERAANARFSVASTAESALLALELRVTPTAVEVADARFVRAPLPSGEADQDLMVIGLGGGRVAHRYAVADPLEGQIEERDRGQHSSMRLPEARLWIYMPAVALDRIELSPARDDAALPRGGIIDAAAVLNRLCDGAPVDACAARALSAPPQAAPAPQQPGPTSPPPPPPPPPPAPG